jgi:diadenosine tetraphosphate (Ap4A) HIT family hydrolase
MGNTGRAAGQTIGHFHFHIFPRKKDDNLPMIE